MDLFFHGLAMLELYNCFVLNIMKTVILNRFRFVVDEWYGLSDHCIAFLIE